MITERDLKEAIAECQGVREPNANTCIKLAAYYVILDHMQEAKPEPPQSYSYAGPPPGAGNTVAYDGESEFAEMINGMSSDLVLSVMDELMKTLSILNPGLYNGVLRKLAEI